MIIVGDIHCKANIVDAVLRMTGEKLFLGDVLDSFDRPPVEDQAELMRKVLDAENTSCLVGNHEASYLYQDMRCSGFQPSLRFYLWKNGLLDRMEKELTSFLCLPGPTLISHAGLTKQIWDEFGLSVDTLERTLQKWYSNRESPYWWIGTCRGGGHPVGGLLWCDFYREFRPIPGLNQIFGHTKVEQLTRMDMGENWNWNIDCLDSSEELLCYNAESGMEPSALPLHDR